MAHMRKVISFEMETKEESRVLKETKRTRKNGSTYEVSVIEREVSTYPVAVLECGHKRTNRFASEDIRGKERLNCWDCDRARRQP